MKKRFVLSIAVLALALPAAAGPASPFPDTPEGKRLAAFFAAADRQDERATRAFIEQNVPPEALRELPLEQRLRNIHGFISRNGPFEVVRVLPRPRRDRAQPGDRLHEA